ncbi:MAG: His/Gly/Thr/Pro-type tRNA ligase C-terminal domain-containing protein, partial [Gaiellaceae bacterium]
HRDAAAEIVAGLRIAGFRVELDDRDESVGKRIRDAELEKLPRVIVYGDRESPQDLAVRRRGGAQMRMSLSDLVIELTPLAAIPNA